MATFEANIKGVHTAHEATITKTFEDVNTLVEACRTEFASISTRLTNVEGRSRGGDSDKGGLMGWKDAVLPNVWNGEESAAEEWFEKVMDYARRRTPGLAEWLKAHEHGEDVIMLGDVALDHPKFDVDKIGGQLHDLLKQTTSGKANLTVVKVSDTNGYEPW